MSQTYIITVAKIVFGNILPHSKFDSDKHTFKIVVKSLFSTSGF